MLLESIKQFIENVTGAKDLFLFSSMISLCAFSTGLCNLQILSRRKDNGETIGTRWSRCRVYNNVTSTLENPSLNIEKSYDNPLNKAMKYRGFQGHPSGIYVAEIRDTKTKEWHWLGT